MTRRQECFLLLLFTLFFAFITFRTKERTIWINEARYADGVDRANMVYIHKFMGGMFK